MESQFLNERRMDAYLSHAQAFLDAKGNNLPATKEELFNWLVEFDVLVGDALCRAVRVYEEHVRLCNRPVLLNNREDVQDAAADEK